MGELEKKLLDPSRVQNYPSSKQPLEFYGERQQKNHPDDAAVS